MSEKLKHNPFIEENLSISSVKKEKNNKDNNNQLIKQDKNNKNDIIIELSNNKKHDEDEKSTNSAEFSGQELRKEKQNSFKNIKQKNLSKKAYEKLTEKLKERTMRMEIEKIDRETERLKQKYEEKNAYLHSFDNNPQFQKMLKSVEKQLLVIFIMGILVCSFSGIVYFYITNRKNGVSLASFSLSMAEICFVFILIITVKLGLLNDPNLSKAFRLFVIIEFLILIGSFVINIIVVIMINEYLEKKSNLVKMITYIVFCLVSVLFIIGFKFCFSLFFESILILLNRKTEYSILMIKEQNSKSESNINGNISTLNNNSTMTLNNDTNSGIISDNQKKNNENAINKEEEQYRHFKYFNRFHYSVTSDRKDDNYFKKKT